MEAINANNARQYQQMSVASRKRNQIARLNAATESQEPQVNAAIKEQITRIIAKLERTQSNKEIARLSLVLERLWNLVLPKAGSRKPGRENKRMAMPVSDDEWQSVATDLATNEANHEKAQ